MNKEKIFSLPKEYKMKNFPVSVDFFIPYFLKKNLKGLEKTLVLKELDCDAWYNEFIDKCVDACGKSYLPVYRMSDGEFSFILGEQPLDKRLSIFKKTRLKLSQLKAKIKLRGGFVAFTQGHYNSGEYTHEECKKAKLEQPEQIKKISEKGILALHLSYVETQPFAERFWPALDKWITKHKIDLKHNNYYSFYFVYSMLTGPRRGELFQNNRILVVNGAGDGKKEKIINSLKKEGVSKVEWISISSKRSMFDIIDVKPYIGKVDLAVIGAGIAKPHILLQMEPLNIPCIDAGFIFEVWANPRNKWERSYCASDDDYAEVENGNTI